LTLPLLILNRTDGALFPEFLFDDWRSLKQIDAEFVGSGNFGITVKRDTFWLVGQSSPASSRLRQSYQSLIGFRRALRFTTFRPKASANARHAVVPWGFRRR